MQGKGTVDSGAPKRQPEPGVYSASKRIVRRAVQRSWLISCRHREAAGNFESRCESVATPLIEHQVDAACALFAFMTKNIVNTMRCWVIKRCGEKRT